MVKGAGVQGRTWGGRAGGEGGVPTMAAAGSDKIAVRNHILGAKNHYGAFEPRRPPRVSLSPPRAAAARRHARSLHVCIGLAGVCAAPARHG